MPITHPNAVKSYPTPADATGTVINKPNVRPVAPISEAAMIEAKGYPNTMAGNTSHSAISHMDSVLTDPFNQIHFGNDEIFKAKQDSARIYQNIQALNKSPASGAGTIKESSPAERMSKVPVPSSLDIATDQ